MKVMSNTVPELLNQLKSYLLGDNAQRKFIMEEPLRAELYSSEFMRQHSAAVASSHVLTKKSSNDRLLKRLSENEAVLLEIRELFRKSLRENSMITPAGEWLLDNFYLIEDQIRTAKKHFPKVYSEGLPQLANGLHAGLPRVYDIVFEIISHSDGRVDVDSMNNFLRSYNSELPFQLGELWAIPIMLRLALIENLRRVSVRIAIDRINRDLAEYWAKKMIEVAESDAKSLIFVIADMARSNPALEQSFVAEFVRLLRGKGPALTQPLNWVEERLLERGITSNDLIQAETQEQAANQVSVANSIGSIRQIGNINWKEFVESNSRVEAILCSDPLYGKMDFSTRDHYRHQVEFIAKNSKLLETDIAEMVIGFAAEAEKNSAPGDPTTHVGYYLIGAGLSKTKQQAKMRRPVFFRIWHALGKFKLFNYLFSVFILSVAFSACIVLLAKADGNKPQLVIALGIIAFICITQLAISLVNFIVTLLASPNLIPRLDYSEFIEKENSTMVIIPTLLTSENDVEELVETLEVRYLGNKMENLYFGLLTDFTDAKTEELPADKPLVQLARKRIIELNHKYGNEKSGPFYLFHRPRKWNPKEKVWMGYERKRGKLTELNLLLRGNSKNNFSVVIGDQSVFSDIKYVITLDTDTLLPRDAAWKLIGAMAHPLNKPVYSEKKQRVVSGYGILQPRVSVSLPESGNTIYSLMNRNDAGIDPYTKATSDVYQDVFGEGSFIGKGIYDVDMFEKTLRSKIPENKILSHDLLEGCYLRSGLLSDVQLFEAYPSRYDTDMTRRKRWIRGDWQILGWCTPFVRGADKRLHKNTLSALSRWKIFDNIRRSVIPIFTTIFILLGWTLLNENIIWTIIVSILLILPLVIISIWELLRKPKQTDIGHHMLITSKAALTHAGNTLFSIICLPYEAFINFFTILRTSWRVIISHKKLLEWAPFKNIEKQRQKNLTREYAKMWFEPFLGIAVFIYLLIYSSGLLIVATPILILWFVAPFIAWRVSRPLKKQLKKLDADEITYLRSIARKTWSFFEQFIDETNNYLPPDNFQEVPYPILAHRTSPTNIGLKLLTDLSAYDFGYVQSGQLIERITSTFRTLDSMERYRGHFYNWYDTISLKPLIPRYVSTVDSGNLAAYLLTLRQGLLAIEDQKIISPKWSAGLEDTFSFFINSLPEADRALFNGLKKDIELLREIPVSNVAEIKSIIEKYLEPHIPEIENLQAETDTAPYQGKLALIRHIKIIRAELLALAPWIFLDEMPPVFRDTLFFNELHSLREIAGIDIATEPEISRLLSLHTDPAEKNWLQQFRSSLSAASKIANQRISALETAALKCEEFANLEFDFLYTKQKQLLSIGYNIEEHRQDPSFYDLLASEARVSTYLGIAQGKLPQESWFALSRLLTHTEGKSVLLSWSGSMFEYLMPNLIMPNYENTLLNQTNEAVVERQIDYGNERNVPWGISESCYNTVDVSSNYQYRAFGVPGLGLQRGLGTDLVIAPYATLLSLMIRPAKAIENLMRMEALGFNGRYGFYESVDYTPTRLLHNQDHALVQTYMAHHHGMSLLSISWLLHDQPMQKRFEAEPQFQAALLLLQERIPKTISFFAHTTQLADAIPASVETEIRVVNNPGTIIPEVQLLSNGKYHVMVTNSGGGYSRWKDLAITRWHEDSTRDNWGNFCYIRDLETGVFWSTTFHPTHKKGKNFEVAFSHGRADFKDLQNKIETHLEIVVSPEDDIEMRRLHITNKSGRKKTIDITTYSEVVIAPAIADALHPAFSNLFVQTEIDSARKIIYCSRRPRASDEKQPWMFHMINMHDKRAEEVSYETDRMAFTGRGKSLANPDAMNKSGRLSNSQGSVLDPIVAIRKKITLNPDEMVIADIITGIGETREICENLVKKYQDKQHKDRVFELAWTHNQVILRQINAAESDAQLYCRLANSIIYINPALRGEQGILMKNRRGKPGLWPYAISGDLPIVLLKIEDDAEIDFAKKIIQAHTFWKLKGLAVDLLILNDSHGGYRQVLQNNLASLIASQTGDAPGKIYLRSSDQISNEDHILFQSVARIIISSRNGTISEQVNRKPLPKAYIANLQIAQNYKPIGEMMNVPNDIILFNGHGGFSSDGKEYIIQSSIENMTPVPWVNVIANPNFGTVISEAGQSYTWSENAHEMRLTPWENDPVSDLCGEVFYIRDEETGHFWSPAPLPTPSKFPYIVKHGFGYSEFEHEEAGIHSAMTVYVDIEAPIKFVVIKIKNNSENDRIISATGYTEWILGDLASKTAMHIVTELDPDSGAIIARNSYNTEYPKRVAFFDVDGRNKSFTGNRNEFIGRNGSLKNPAALSRIKLSGTLGAGFDPCSALQINFELAAGQEKEIIFKIGAGKNITDASNTARQFRGGIAARESLERVKKYWGNLINAFITTTPDISVNLLVNGWLTYQIIACRLWARSGYYQSGGAFGFRDQLQDALSILHTAPEFARQHILLCASRQFKEGDVQHWWHPPIDRGVRTRCSDDYLWLPMVVCKYIHATGDSEILINEVAFLDGRQLNLDEDSYYDVAIQSGETATVYEHCVRAIKHGLRFGAHGLPLIGTGDWNDGMDRVGRKGAGESVWLAFFLYDVITEFSEIAMMQSDHTFSELCNTEAKKLKDNINKNAWDGNWYRRAYFDDGTPLGSAKNEECKIDSISQSWSVLSGAGDPERVKIAMQSAEEHLVNKEFGLIRLLEPAFNNTSTDPGYIKGYVPGVRENGGQYTHAAIWMIMAMAKLGKNKTAWELLKMINPINHGSSSAGIATYKVEPYVVAADVYAVAPHTGRGGWTWYTGSAGWMYQLITNSLLGIKRTGSILSIAPCAPPDWNEYSIRYRYLSAFYNLHFQFESGEGIITIKYDNENISGDSIELKDDGQEHHIEIILFHNPS